VGRIGRSKADAQTQLEQAMSTLVAEVRGDELSGDTRMARIAQMRTAELDREANLTDRPPSTVRHYRSHLKNWVLPAIGELQARELTVTTSDRLVKKVHDATSYDNGKNVRAVLTGLCGYGVRLAMAINPAGLVRPSCARRAEAGSSARSGATERPACEARTADG
jgi:hypothetical protein